MKRRKLNWHRVCPWIPFIGIPMTAYYHGTYHDTGLDNIFINVSSAIWQAISMGLIVLKLSGTI